MFKSSELSRPLGHLSGSWISEKRVLSALQQPDPLKTHQAAYSEINITHCQGFKYWAPLFRDRFCSMSRRRCLPNAVVNCPAILSCTDTCSTSAPVKGEVCGFMCSRAGWLHSKRVRQALKQGTEKVYRSRNAVIWGEEKEFSSVLIWACIALRVIAIPESCVFTSTML